MKASNVYFNYTGQTPCTDISDVDATGQLDGAGWNVLACNQLAMPTTNGKDSMFIPNDPFDYDAYTSKYNTTLLIHPSRNVPRQVRAYSKIWMGLGLLWRIKHSKRILSSQ